MSTSKIVALTEYYSTHADRLIKTYSRRSNGLHNAEDIVHDAFAKALRYIDTYTEDRPMPQWFNTILNRSFKDFMSNERRHGMTVDQDRVVEDLTDEVYKEQVVQSLVAEISAMGEPARSILQMFVILGHRGKEVAHDLDVNIHTVRKCIQLYYNEVRDRYA